MHQALLRANDTVIVAVDLQSVFMKVIHDIDRVVANSKLLLRSASILHVPVVATSQNAEKLGGVHEEIAALLTEPVIDKMTFSASRSPEFTAALTRHGRKQIVLCGVETHICVTQTALDLVDAGYQVHVVVDAVSSRSMEKHKLGMERLRDNGALPIASEAVVYELLGQAGTPEFREILKLVR